MKPKAKEGVKQVTVRLAVEDWQRVAHLAIDERTSIHELIVRGLNEVLKSKKMPLISQGR